MKPQITVLIPARNSSKTIEKAITSVLVQSYSDFEVLVVINDTSDDTLEVVSSIKDSRIKILDSQPGIVPALNVGLQNASGKYIFRQDADDEWFQDKLKFQIERLTHDDVDILGTQMLIKEDQKDDVITNYPIKHRDCINWLVSNRNPIGHPTVAIKKKIFDKVGGYWEFFPFAEDLDLWMRCLPHAKFENLDFLGIQYNFKPNKNYNPNVPGILTRHYLNVYGVK
jgi:glycosyltransferase involved in cell wall biosynthesis